jgi:hypothetical protein
MDLLLIDTPGTADDNTLNAIRAADGCLVVSRPNYFDIAGSVISATTVRQLGKPGMVVLNQAPWERVGLEPPSLRNARDALLFTKMPVANATIGARKAYATSIPGGLSPEEAEPTSAAAGEIAQLWREFSESIGLDKCKVKKAVTGPPAMERRMATIAAMPSTSAHPPLTPKTVEVGRYAGSPSQPIEGARCAPQLLGDRRPRRLRGILVRARSCERPLALKARGAAAAPSEGHLKPRSGAALAVKKSKMQKHTAPLEPAESALRDASRRSTRLRHVFYDGARTRPRANR